MSRRHRCRVALITGGSRGIGFETGRLLVEHGASVLLVARREGPLQEAARRLVQSTPKPGGVETYAGNAGNPDDADAAVLLAHGALRFGGHPGEQRGHESLLRATSRTLTCPPAR